ncbi:hypothetical protein [Pseudanabaena sp. BC1403]|nr:hypothetical protein [Pseudanabaena sp. BC1403]
MQNPKLDDALRDRLIRAIAELNVVAACLESEYGDLIPINLSPKG